MPGCTSTAIKTTHVWYNPSSQFVSPIPTMRFYGLNIWFVWCDLRSHCSLLFLEWVNLLWKIKQNNFSATLSALIQVPKSHTCYHTCMWTPTMAASTWLPTVVHTHSPGIPTVPTTQASLEGYISQPLVEALHCTDTVLHDLTIPIVNHFTLNWRKQILETVHFIWN